jgi:LacI family transcriptional regulator
MAVTLKDIARRVGKSVTTVSRALHDFDDVSPETKEIVRQAAAEMGYTPSSFAQRLQKQKSETIGLILPTYGPRFSDPFFSEFLAGVGNKAAEEGLDVLVSTRPPGQDEMQAYHSIVQGRRVDGFIVVRTRRQDPRIEYLCERKFPFAAFGRVEGTCDFPFVDENSAYGMQLVVNHLVSLGHRRIAFIAAPDDLMFAHHRMKGFREGLQRQGVPLDESLILIGDLTQRSGYSQGKALFSLPNPPTAVVACNDLMAIGAMSAAYKKGLVVGKDVAITGFDDIPLSEHSHPPLTTVHQPIYKIGQMVCERLIQHIQGICVAQEHTILTPSLVVRQSCGSNLQNAGEAVYAQGLAGR